MNHLFDQQNYVETGCVIQKMKSYREKSSTKYHLTKSIRSNFEGSFYFLNQQKFLQQYKQKAESNYKLEKKISQKKSLTRKITD